MQWLKDRWAALKGALGHRRYMVGTLILTIVAVSDSVAGYFLGESLANLTGIPAWCYSALLALVITWVWLLEYVVTLRTLRKGAFEEVAELREKGVSLRNKIRAHYGNNIPTDPETWIADIMAWHGEVELAIRKIDSGVAIWYRTIDIMPPPRLPLASSDPKIRHYYQMHDRRLDNLGALIRDMLVANKQHI